MRLLADMHISPRTVEFLRSLGHDVVRVNAILPATASDETIVALGHRMANISPDPSSPPCDPVSSRAGFGQSCAIGERLVHPMELILVRCHVLSVGLSGLISRSQPLSRIR